VVKLQARVEALEAEVRQLLSRTSGDVVGSLVDETTIGKKLEASVAGALD